MKLGCVIMAAGSGSRFGGNKLLAELAGIPLYRRALEAVPEDVFEKIAVVTGCSTVAQAARDKGFAVVSNRQPELGISLTIRLGLQAMADCGGVLFMAADQPFLTAETVKRLAQAFLAQPDCIHAAAANGRRGNPCLFPAALFPALLQLEGDTGGAKVIRANPQLLRLTEVPARELLDADTPAALDGLTAEKH